MEVFQKRSRWSNFNIPTGFITPSSSSSLTCSCPQYAVHTHSTVCELDKSSFFTETLILTFIFPTFPRISKILTYQKCWKISIKGLIWIFAPKSKKLSETSDVWIFMLTIEQTYWTKINVSNSVYKQSTNAHLPQF